MVHNKLKINLKCRRCNDFLVGVHKEHLAACMRESVGLNAIIPRFDRVCVLDYVFLFASCAIDFYVLLILFRSFYFGLLFFFHTIPHSLSFYLMLPHFFTFYSSFHCFYPGNEQTLAYAKCVCCVAVLAFICMLPINIRILYVYGSVC